MKNEVMRVTLSDHAKDRCIERSIDPYMCEYARKYGKKLSHRGAYILHMSDIPKKVLDELSPEYKRKLDKTLPICAIWTTNDDMFVCLTAWRIFSNTNYRRLNWRKGQPGKKQHGYKEMKRRNAT